MLTLTLVLLSSLAPYDYSTVVVELVHSRRWGHLHISYTYVPSFNVSRFYFLGWLHH